MTARTPIASTVPEPWAKSPKPGLWHVEGMELPAYIQHVSHELFNSGAAKTESQAIQMAVGIVKKWAAGIPVGGETKVGGKKSKHVGHVHPDVQAAAIKAMAEWDAKRARAHAQHASHEHTRSNGMGTPINLAKGVRQATDSELLAMPLEQIIEHHETACITLSAEHEYTKKVAEVRLSKEGPTREKMINHLKEIHRVTPQAALNLSQLHDHHASDHASGDQNLFPHSHTHDLEPRRLRPRQRAADLSVPVGVPVKFNAWGEKIDLAAPAMTSGNGSLISPVVSSSDGPRTTRGSVDLAGGKVHSHGKGGNVRPVANMSAMGLRAHMATLHGMTPSTTNFARLRALHAAMHSTNPNPKPHMSQGLPKANVDTFSVTGGRSLELSQGNMMKSGDATSKGNYMGFGKLVARLIKQGKSPEEAKKIAAFIGRKKYGAKKMASAAAGRTPLGPKS